MLMHKTLHKKIIILIFVYACVLGSALSGCASTRIKYLSGKDFIQQAAQIDQPNSLHWTSYIGISHDRAYLEYGHPAFIGRGTRTTVYWTFLSELPEELVTQLKAGLTPQGPRRDVLEKKGEDSK